MINIFHGNCIDAQKRISDKSVDLMICDPPFGLGETQFEKFYNRNPNNIIKGYEEAPKDYDLWTYQWLQEAVRVLKDTGSMYVVMGHTNLRALLNAAYQLNLHEINHLIWKYNFGVNTTRKYVTSHYHILYYVKSKNVKPTFNTYCRYGAQEKDADGGSCVYKDLEDVFIIRREYAPNEIKNQNKLPEELIRKLIMYSSNEQDVVCDFFMGNFTTAYAAHQLGRHVTGYEINDVAYNYHTQQLQKIEFGCYLKDLKVVVNNLPRNKGARLSHVEKTAISNEFASLVSQGMSKKEANVELQKKYGRGKFSISNIIKSPKI